jgi:dUTP pyrophosphatase
VAELPGSARAAGGFGSTGGHAAVETPSAGTSTDGYASVRSDREGQ